MFTSNLFIPQFFTLLLKNSTKTGKLGKITGKRICRLNAYEGKILALLFSAPIQVIFLFQMPSVQKQTLIVLV